jgi:hypothetical protein
LNSFSLDDILQAAQQPKPFNVPVSINLCERARTDWLAAALYVEQQAAAQAQRRAVTNGVPRLNRLTLEFIREGADEGDRHRLLFSAAANLAAFGCPPALAHALLTEAALDSGLSPSDVRRQVECGLSAPK